MTYIERTAAKLFHETVGRGIAAVRERKVNIFLETLKPNEYFSSVIPPYVSQIANADHSKISEFYGFINDEKAAQRFGTNNLEEFSFWAWRSCGVVDAQMVLMASKGKSFDKTTMQLITEGLDLEGYDVKENIGWYHSALVELMKKYGIESTMKKFTPSSEIAKDILENKYVLASVKSETGGHILLIYGFKIEDNGRLTGFFVNDPNNYYEDGDNKYITKHEFDELFTRRTIVVNLD
ncbi:C39 family peptidase [Candidatus Microgenomates bacterium]|nr:C39 family peptidase [Candidatus Microgenomates bacterium]